MSWRMGSALEAARSTKRKPAWWRSRVVRATLCAAPPLHRLALPARGSDRDEASDPVEGAFHAGEKVAVGPGVRPLGRVRLITASPTDAPAASTA